MASTQVIKHQEKLTMQVQSLEMIELKVNRVPAIVNVAAILSL